MDRDLMAQLVSKINAGFPGPPFVHGFGEGTSGAAQAAAFFVAIHQNVLATKVSKHLVTQIAGDSLSAVIPKHDSAVVIHQIHSGLQSFHDRPENLGIEKCWHDENL